MWFFLANILLKVVSLPPASHKTSHFYLHLHPRHSFLVLILISLGGTYWFFLGDDLFLYFIFINKMHFLFCLGSPGLTLSESPNLLCTKVAKKIQPSGYDAVWVTQRHHDEEKSYIALFADWIHCLVILSYKWCKPSHLAACESEMCLILQLYFVLSWFVFWSSLSVAVQ